MVLVILEEVWFGRFAFGAGIARLGVECGDRARRKIDDAGFGKVIAVEGGLVFEFASLR